MPSNQYSPTAEQPYQPYEAPPVAAPNPPAIAPPAQQGFQFTGAPISKAGAVAGVLDNVFRGYMQGKAQHAANVTRQFQEKTNNLHASYEQDAQRLYALAQSGADPNSDEYKTATSAVNGSWGALQDWREKVINGPEGGKSKKSSGKKQADQPPPTPQQQQQQLMMDLQSPDPKVKAAAGFALQKKLGPPVLWQVKQFQTPEAQASRKAANIGSQADVLQQQNRMTKEQSQAVYDHYAGMTEDQLGKLKPEERQAFDNSKNVLFPLEARRGSYKVVTGRVGDQQMSILQGPNGEFTDMIGNPVPEPTLKAFVADKTAPKPAKVTWKGTSMVDVIDSAGKTWTPEELKKGEGGEEAQALYKSALKAQDEQRALEKQKMDAWYSHANYSDTLQTKRAIRTLGLKADAADIKNWSKQEDKANSAEELYQESARVKTPTPTSEQKLLMAWVRSNVAGAGRINDTEIKRGLGAGSYGTRAQNAWNQAIDGTLAPELHKDFLGDLRNAAQANREESDHLKEEYGIDDDALKAIAQAQTPSKGGGKPAPSKPDAGGFDWNAHPVVKP